MAVAHDQHVRMGGYVRQRGKARGQDEQRHRHQPPEWDASGEPASEEVSGERRQRRDDERFVVGLRAEPALRENRFVEEPDSGGDEAVQRGADGKHPEHACQQRLGPERAVRGVRAAGRGVNRGRDRIAVRKKAVRLRSAANQRGRQRRQETQQAATHRQPCAAPSPLLNEDCRPAERRA